MQNKDLTFLITDFDSTDILLIDSFRLKFIFEVRFENIRAINFYIQFTFLLLFLLFLDTFTIFSV